jgi:phosphoglucomutase
MQDKILEQYQLWLKNATADTDIINELKAMEHDEAKIEDAFYRELAFGTGGLRGTIGAGTNRLNVHTVAKASQGLSDYVIKNFPEEERKIAVAYDSRIKSDLFAQVASGVFAAKYNGYKVYGADGCQITTEAAADILGEIQKLEKQ